MKSDFSKYEVTENAIRPDPKNSYYTLPRTYGVYHLCGADKSLATRLYRYGNHPVRMHELQREYGSVELVVLYTNREFAQQRAGHENKLMESR